MTGVKPWQQNEPDRNGAPTVTIRVGCHDVRRVCRRLASDVGVSARFGQNEVKGAFEVTLPSSPALIEFCTNSLGTLLTVDRE